MRRPRFLPRLRLAATGVAVLLAAASLPATADSIDLGNASVLSRQGQRLLVAIPFGSAPGERIAVTRFRVVSVEATGSGGTAPEAARFAIAKPQDRNVVFLRSEQPVDLDRARIVVAVSGPDGENTGTTYDLVIPPPGISVGSQARVMR